MKVMKDLKADTVNNLAGDGLSADARIDSDHIRHTGSLERSLRR